MSLGLLLLAFENSHFLNYICLVSSDSDFTGLALRIREEGLIVLGFGEEKTPEAFRNACHKFVLTEVLRPVIQQKSESATRTGLQTQQIAVQSNTPKMQESVSKHSPDDFILKALENTSDDTGWANLGTLGSYLTKLKSDFDTRLYGFKKLSDLVKAREDIFLIEERNTPDSPAKALYIRRK